MQYIIVTVVTRDNGSVKELVRADKIEYYKKPSNRFKVKGEFSGTLLLSNERYSKFLKTNIERAFLDFDTEVFEAEDDDAARLIFEVMKNE